MTDLASRVAKGAAWNTAASLARIGSNVLILPILARFLEPRDFGLVQMGAPIVIFLMTVSELGVTPAIVRADNPDRKMWSSVLWTHAGGAVFAALLLVLAAPSLGVYYHEPEVVPILYGLAGILVLQSFINLPCAWLQRELRFEYLAIVDVATNLFSMLVAIVTAYYGAGAWALVYQQLSLYLSKGILWWLAAQPPVGFVYSISSIRGIMGFSLNLVGAQVVNFFTRIAEPLLIGRVLDAAALGFYSLATRLVIFPVQIFAWSLTGTLFPALTKVKDEPHRLRTACVRILRLVTIMAFPIIAGMAALAEPLVEFLLGKKMAPAGPVLAILGPVAAIQCVTSTYGTIFMATGRTDVMFRWSLYTAIVTVAAMWVGVYYGIEGVAIGSLIAHAALFLPTSRAVFAQLEGNLTDVARAIGVNALNATLMAVAVYLASHQLGKSGYGALEQLVVCIPLGVVLYCGFILLFQRETAWDLSSLVRNVVAKQAS